MDFLRMDSESRFAIWQALRQPQNLALIAIVLLAGAIAIPGIQWGLPDRLGWAADELTPDRVLEAIDLGFSNGWHYKYPPVQYYLLSLFYMPVLTLAQLGWIDRASDNTYMLLFGLGRSLSVVMGMGTVALIYQLGKEIFSVKTGLFAALIFALTPVYVYYAKITNLDIPMLFWLVGFLILYGRLLKYQKPSDYRWCAVLATIAVCTKDPAYGFVSLPAFLPWLLYGRQLKQANQNISWGAIFRQVASDRRVWQPIAIGIFGFLLLSNAFLNFEGFIDRINLLLYGSATIRPRYSEDWWGQWQMFGTTLRTFRFMFGWPVAIAILIGLGRYLWHLATAKPKQRNWIPLGLLFPSVSYYFLYVTPVMYNPDRYLMPLMPILAIFGGTFAAEMLSKKGRTRWIAGAIAAGALTYTLAYAWTPNTLMVHDSRYQVETWMTENIPKDALVLRVGIRKYLPRLGGFTTEHIEAPNIEEIEALQPEFIVISSGYDERRFKVYDPAHQFFATLKSEALGYKQILRKQTRPEGYLFDFDEVNDRAIDTMAVYTNFDKVDPEIQIFRKY